MGLTARRAFLTISPTLRPFGAFPIPAVLDPSYPLMEHDSLLAGQIRVHPDVVWRDVDGEIVLLNVVTGQYFGLDEVGSRIWLFLQQDGEAGTRFSTLQDRVTAEFEVDQPTVSADLAALLKQLIEQQLVIVGV